MTKPLGRLQPPDFDHVGAYPLTALIADPAHELAIPPAGTEKSLGLPWWWRQHDQGQEGACVGFGASAMMSITNHAQRLRETGKDVTYRYDARWLYLESQLIDDWDETPPEEGTSVRAACDILRDRGHRRVQRGVVGAEHLAHGISTNRWARSVDELRAAIYAGLAVAIGISWYSSYDTPELINGELWRRWKPNAFVRGGHCTCLYRFSDRRQAFREMNSWGEAQPPVWVSYADIERGLVEYGEFTVITDR